MTTATKTQFDEARASETRVDAFPWGALAETRAISTCLFTNDELFRAGCDHFLATSDEVDMRLSTGLPDLDEARDAVSAISPDVVVFGVTEMRQETLEFVVGVHETHPSSGTILIFSHARDSIVGGLRHVSAQIRVGFACVQKDSVASAKDLIQLIRSVADGRVLLDQSVMDRLFSMEDERNSIAARLTKREAEVLDLMAMGHTNPGIAECLFLERKTVERHINAIYTKLDDQAALGHPRVHTVLAYLRATGRLDSTWR